MIRTERATEPASVVDQQFRSLVDRILRCREIEDEAKDDTKELYAEAKGCGYDKASLGALVRELRSKGKDAQKFAEDTAILDLYRDAYERASHVRAREGQTKSDAVKPVRNDVSGLSIVAGRLVGEASQPAGSGSDEIPASISNSQPEPSPDLAATVPEVRPPPASGTTIFKVVSQADQIRLLRPNCKHADNLSKCGGNGRNHCRECSRATAEAAE